MKTALGEARRRLQRFRHDPVGHARHAAKVLLKFHLMEVHEQRLDALQTWAANTPLHAAVWARHFSQASLTDWTLGIAGELANSGALTMDGPCIRDAVASP